MKIQIDFTNKTIKIEENVNLREFITKIQVLLGKEYEEYSLIPEVIMNWNNPIYIPFPTEPVYPNPYYPTWMASETENYTTSNTGIYNISM